MATAFSGIDPSPTIPLGISQFPKDILVLPKRFERCLFWSFFPELTCGSTAGPEPWETSFSTQTTSVAGILRRTRSPKISRAI